ncbi:hypothetical protein AHF37_01575 [Paragonimus kellicotti]|nr:hypothetical protein AHF37_01575 [Paragonimus kellicotti]
MLLSLLISYLLCTAAFAAVDDVQTLLIGHLSPDDKRWLKHFFEQNLVDNLKVPSKTYHIMLGLDALDESITEKRIACSSLNVPLTSADIAFYHAYGITRLGLPDCKLAATELNALVKSKLAGNPSIDDLFYVVMAIKEAKLEVDTSTVTGLVNKIKAKDSNPATVALVLQIVSTLNLSKAALKPYMDDVRSVLDQADELDGNMLFFEKGLYTTSLVAKGISDLINAYGGADELPENKILKLINFIYTRLRSNNLRAAAHLISAFKALATNPYLAPIVIKSDRLIADGGAVHYGQPNLKLKLVSLWGDVVFGPDTMILKAGGLFAVQQLTKVLTLVGPTERGAFTAESGLYDEWVTKLAVGVLLAMELIYEVPLRVLTEAEVVDPVLIVMDVVSDRQVADINGRSSELTCGTSASGCPISSFTLGSLLFLHSTSSTGAI